MEKNRNKKEVVKKVLEKEIKNLNNGWFPNWESQEDHKYAVVYDYRRKTFAYQDHIRVKSIENSMYLKEARFVYQLIESHFKELVAYFEVGENF